MVGGGRWGLTGSQAGGMLWENAGGAHAQGQVLGESCPNCRRLQTLVGEVIAELHAEGQVEIVTDWWSTASYGVWAVPGLVVGEHIKAQGCLPAKEAVRGWIEGTLSGRPEVGMLCEACQVGREGR